MNRTLYRNNIFNFVAVVLFVMSFSAFGQQAQAKQDMIKIVAGQEIMTLDNTQFGSGNDKIVIDNWGEYLLQKQTSGEVTTGLITSYTLSPDGLKMECTLRKGVKFHSGDILTAKDVKFSFERCKKVNRSMKRNLEFVKGVEIIDDHHFNFIFSKFDVNFIPRMCAGLPVISKSYYDRVGEKTFAKNPKGTGPYKYVTYKPGEYVEIERFEEYWGEKPPIKKARYYFVGEGTTRIAKLKTGEVDLIQAVPYPEVKGVEQSSDLKIVKLETNHPTRSILMGSKNPNVPWHDKRVRMAMALAIDEQSIIKNLLSNIPIHLAALNTNEVGYDPNLKPYGYDPEKAKKLLAEAGYPNGIEVTLNFPFGGRVAMARETAEMIAGYWQAVGIRTKLVGKETAVMLADRKKALKKDVNYVAFYTAGMSGGPDPTHTIKNYLTSNGSRPVYSNPESDKLIREGIHTPDKEKRAGLIKKAARLIHDDVGYIPIFTNVSVYGMRKNVDFTPTKGINFDYLFAKDMKFIE